MKVLMTADAVGGVWTYALELCNALADHGVEFVLATIGPAPTAAQRERVGELRNVHLEHASLKLEWMEQPWADVEKVGRWLLDLATRENVDLVHLNGYAHAVLPWRRPVLVVAHSCVCSWWEAVHGHAAPTEWNPYRHVVGAGLHAAQLVIAPTAAFLATLESHYGALTRASVIRNARTAPPAREGNSRLPIVMACGRVWDEAKNFQVLDAAARGLSWPVYVAGEGTSPDGRECTLSNLNCLGSLPANEMAMWLDRAEIFVHPARYEPFGLAVLEAAMHACALVLSDVPTLRELWDGAALFADPHDPIALRQRVHSLIDNPGQRAALARAALQRAERYQPHTMGKAYLEVYRDLLQQRGSKERAVA
jgi:glycogen synthase